MATEAATSERPLPLSQNELVRQVVLLVGGGLVLGGVIPAVFARTFFNPWGASLLAAGLVVLLPAAIVFFAPHLLTLVRRELSAFFLSPIAYMVLIAMTFLAGWSYLELVSQLLMPRVMFSGLEDPILQYMGTNIWLLFCLLVLPGIVTMRLFSEERRSGSIELLLTAPVTESEVVISKFLAGLIFYIILWVPWGVFLFGLYRKASFDYLPVVSVYFGLLLLGATFVAGGLFFSSLTRNQIISFILTFAMMVLFLAIVVLQWIWEQRGFDRKWLDAMKYLSYYLQMRDFGLGKVDIRYVVLHLSLAAFFLFGTIKVIETQKGK